MPWSRLEGLCWAVQIKAVEENRVVVLDQGSNELRQVPFGTCIWTTGIRMHPLSEKLAEQLQGEQEHWCARPALHAQCMGNCGRPLGDGIVSSQVGQPLITVCIVAHEVRCARIVADEMRCARCDPGAHSRWTDVSWSREQATSLLWGMQQPLNRQAASACLLHILWNHAITISQAHSVPEA